MTHPRLHIALVVPGFSAGEAHWAIPALLDLVRALALHHQVEVFTLRYPHQRGSYPLAGATVHALGGAQAAGVARLPLLRRAIAHIGVRHQMQRFDIIHGLWADEPGFVAVAVGRMFGIPAIVSLMGGELAALPEIGYGGQLSRVNRLLTAVALRGAAHVTVGSPFLAEKARQHASVRRLAVVPLGVDTALFRPQTEATPALPSRQFTMLHVGSLVPVKDQATLLRAFAQIHAKHRATALHIVGSGPLEGELRVLAAQLGITAAMTLHGDIAHATLPQHYHTADLYVHTSRHESQGVVLLEALACERPVVGTAVGLVTALAPAALAVPVGDDAALAAAIDSLFANTRQRRAMGALGRQLVTASYRIEHTHHAFGALYAAHSLEKRTRR